MRSFLLWLFVLVLVGAGGYYVANLVFDNTLKGEVDLRLAAAKKVVVIDYEKVHYNMLNRQTEMSGIEAHLPGSTNSLKIAKAILHRFDEDFPEIAHVSASGVHIEQLTNLPALRERMDALGIGDLPMDLELEYGYDSYKKNLEMRKLTISAPEVGQLAISFELVEFEPRKMEWKGDGFNPLTALNLSLKKAEIEYTDSGLAARAIDQAARADGVAREEWVEAEVARLTQQYPADQNPLNAELAGSWERFLRDPSGLKLAAKPPIPASIVMLIFTRPERMPTMLGLDLKNQ